jgi:Cu/Ag efflux protein CusF
MRKTTRGIVTMLSSLAFVVAISLSAYAQAPAGQAPGEKPAGQAQKSDSAKGELKSVDAAKMTLTLASGETFMYTDQTKVTGAQGGVAGLASASGRQVTINFTTKGADRIATSIEVAPK